jgi:hypothetical protein
MSDIDDSFNIFYMSDVRFDTLEGRKSAFLEFYNQGWGITKIANLLEIEVHHSNKLPDKTLGAIQYDDETEKFQMIINVKNKINTITSKSRVLMIVVHEVAHWIYDYDDMKKNGGFVPGVKPGKTTGEYIDAVISKITLPGSIFLALIAIMPSIAIILGVNSQFANFFGGTSLLILVGVVLDTLQQVESHLLMRHYDGLMKTGRIKGRTPVQAGGPAM